MALRAYRLLRDHFIAEALRAKGEVVTIEEGTQSSDMEPVEPEPKAKAEHEPEPKAKSEPPSRR
jgi:hypothetical protein